jgi:hypothetical protein
MLRAPHSHLQQRGKAVIVLSSAEVRAAALHTQDDRIFIILSSHRLNPCLLTSESLRSNSRIASDVPEHVRNQSGDES